MLVNKVSYTRWIRQTGFWTSLELIGYKWFCRRGVLGWGQGKKVRQSECWRFCVNIHWGDVWTVLPHRVWGFGRGGLDVLRCRIHQGQFSWMAGLHKNKHRHFEKYESIDVDVCMCSTTLLPLLQPNTQAHTSPLTLPLNLLPQLMSFLLPINDSF